MPLQMTLKCTHKVSCIHTHTISVASFASLTFTCMQSKKMAFHTLLSFHFPILLFRHSSSLSYSRSLSFTLILLLTTLFSVGLAGCCSVAAPKRGPFCWNSFGGIKKGARTTPHPNSTLPLSIHSSAFSSSRPHCLEREGGS